MGFPKKSDNKTEKKIVSEPKVTLVKKPKVEKVTTTKQDDVSVAEPEVSTTTQVTEDNNVDNIIQRRIEELPERRVFYIDAGDTTPDKVHELLDRVKDELQTLPIDNIANENTSSIEIKNVDVRSVEPKRVNTSTLGQRLKYQTEIREKAKQEMLAEKMKEYEARERERRARVSDFFNKATTYVSEAIEDNRIIDTLKLPDYVEYTSDNNDRNSISNEHHKDHDIYLKFVKWCKDNELIAFFDYEQSNGGKNSCYKLRVVPNI